MEKLEKKWCQVREFYLYEEEKTTPCEQIKRVDLSGVERLCDVGGGSGAFSIVFARKYVMFCFPSVKNRNKRQRQRHMVFFVFVEQTKKPPFPPLSFFPTISRTSVSIFFLVLSRGLCIQSTFNQYHH